MELTLLYSLSVWFAVICAIVVWRRRERRWAMGTFAAALIPVVGVMVAITALAQGAAEPTTLDSPCPECGNGDGYARGGMFDRETRVSVSRVLSIAGALAAFALAAGAIAMAVSVWAGGDDGIIQWQYGSGAAGLGFLVVGLGLAIQLAKPAIAYRSADRVPGLAYRCGACRATWTRLDGDDPAAPRDLPAPGPAKAA